MEKQDQKKPQQQKNKNEGIVQERPSHMNQGNQTFYPDKTRRPQKGIVKKPPVRKTP
jgi:hypothetical protein